MNKVAGKYDAFSDLKTARKQGTRVLGRGKRYRPGCEIPVLQVGEIDTSVMYCTTKDVAEAAGQDTKQVRYQIEQGRLPAFIFHGRIFIHPDDVSAYLELVNCGLIPRKDTRRSTYETT